MQGPEVRSAERIRSRSRRTGSAVGSPRRVSHQVRAGSASVGTGSCWRRGIGIPAEIDGGDEASGAFDERRRSEGPGPRAFAQHRDALRIDAAARELGAGSLEILESGLDEAPVGGVAERPAEAPRAAQAKAQDRDAAVGEKLQEGMELHPGRRSCVVFDP